MKKNNSIAIKNNPTLETDAFLLEYLHEIMEDTREHVLAGKAYGTTGENLVAAHIFLLVRKIGLEEYVDRSEWDSLNTLHCAPRLLLVLQTRYLSLMERNKLHFALSERAQPLVSKHSKDRVERYVHRWKIMEFARLLQQD